MTRQELEERLAVDLKAGEAVLRADLERILQPLRAPGTAGPQTTLVVTPPAPQQAVSAATGAPAASAQANAAGSTPFVFNLGMQPQVLTELLYAVAPPGLATKGAFKFAAAAPAGKQTTILLPVLPGTVALFTAPLGVRSDFYSTSLLADVYLGTDTGTYEITSPPYLFPISDGDQIDSLQYTYITQYLEGIITNDTSTNATLVFKAEMLAVERNLFLNQFWVPLLQKMLSVAQAQASEYARGR